jgi:hypothetical protein
VRFQKGQSGNPAGRKPKDGTPTREAVLRHLWRLVHAKEPNHSVIVGCKALLEALPAPKPDDMILPAAPPAQAPEAPSLEEQLDS